MKRILSTLLVAAVLLSFAAVGLCKERPTRVIDVVYDDSGSMVKLDSGNLVDTWCQAKYAMEVFAAMLETNDTLNVFAMSEYDLKGAAKGNKVSINGSSPASSRVATIHNMPTKIAQTTPFRPVEAAAGHLMNSSQEQKWLVIVTDGKFERKGAGGKIETMPVSDIENQLSSLTSKGIKVVFLSIGKEAGGITNRPENNIFFYRANESKDTIVRITEICNRIFERNTIKNYKTSSGTFNVDVPMEEVIIFAQGGNVKIESLEINGEAAGKNTEVPVQYCDRTNVAVKPQLQSQILVANNLKGVVATFRNEKSIFPDGIYKLKVSGADDVQIYYKPNITIGYELTQNGKKLPVSNKLLEGKFQINFNLLNPLTEKPVKSDLLGNIDYSGTIEQNGEKMAVTNGSTVEIKPGQATIDVKGTFLEYNTVAINKTYRILEAASPLQMSVEPSTPKFNIKEFKNAQPMVLTVKQNGKIITQQKWDAMPLPKVKSEKDIEFDVKKGTNVGTFIITPKYYKDDMYATADGDIPFTVNAQFTYDEQISMGQLESSMNVEGLTWLERITDFWKKHRGLIIGGVVVFGLLLGYIPGIKKYLPHLKPYLVGRTGQRPCKNYRLKKFSCICPYIPVHAIINPNVNGMLSGGTSLDIKAKSNMGSFVLVNSKQFEFKTNEKKIVKAIISGAAPEAPKGGYVLNKGMQIVYSKNKDSFTLVLKK